VEMKAVSCQELRFERGDRVVTGKRWHQGGIPTFALHGWLDNANSFNYLAPLLPELDIVALDFAGHGYSDHRPAGVAYRGDLDIEDVIAAADQLGWERFNIIGHSMGAEYGSRLAGLFPEKVINLICIDGFMESDVGDKLVELRAKLILVALNQTTTKTKVFDSLEEMTDRVEKATGQQRNSAFELIQRGYKKIGEGYTWITDPKLKQDAWEVLAADELEALVKRTTAPTLVIDASDGQSWFRSALDMIKSYHPSLKIVLINGSHHLHMEEPAASEVLKSVRSFLGLAG